MYSITIYINSFRCKIFKYGIKIYMIHESQFYQYNNMDIEYFIECIYFKLKTYL